MPKRLDPLEANQRRSIKVKFELAGELKKAAVKYCHNREQYMVNFCKDAIAEKLAKDGYLPK